MFTSNGPIGNEGYVIANGTTSTDPFITYYSQRDPTTYDYNFPIKKRWINFQNNSGPAREWVLESFTNVSGQTLANWVLLASGGSAMLFLTVPLGINTIVPDAGTGEIIFTSAGNTIDITGSSAAPNNHTVNFDVAPTPPALNLLTVPLGVTSIVPDSPTGEIIFTSSGGTIAITGSNAAPNNHTVNFDIVAPTPPINTLSDNDDVLVSPNITGNIKLEGQLNEQVGFFSTTVSDAPNNLIKINPMSSTRWIVDPLSTANNPNGTHTTIQSAITSATSGDTIIVMPGTYTENLALKPGISIVAYNGDQLFGIVKIVGKCSLSTAGIVNISNIELETNSDFLLEVTGNALSFVLLNNCYLNCTNNTGISLTSSNSSSLIRIFNSGGNLATTGIALFSHSGAGNIELKFNRFENTGLSTTASTVSSGSVLIGYCTIDNPLEVSGTAVAQIFYTLFQTAATSTTCLVQTSTTGNVTCRDCGFTSLNAACISIGAGATVVVANCNVNSNAANAITGAGTLINGGVSMVTSAGINTTTQTARNIDVGGISFDGGVNTLSNYTVGTYTPTMIGTVAGITTYSSQHGYYIRIGSSVTIQAVVTGTAATGTGNVILGNFPFTIKNQTNGTAIGSVLTANAAAWVFPAGTTCQVLHATFNGTLANIYCSGSGVVGGARQMANANFNFQYTVTYEI